MKTRTKYFVITIISLIEFGCTDNSDNASLAHELIGSWKWRYVCGGITGACGYANQSDTRTLEITEDIMTETSNDGFVTSTAYYISSKINNEDYTEYIVQFENGISSKLFTSAGGMIGMKLYS